MEQRPKERESLWQAVNANGVKVLITDIKVGLTFVQLAESHGAGEVATRNIGKARVAYDSITRLRPRFSPSSEESGILDAKLDELKQRLHALGETF